MSGAGKPSGMPVFNLTNKTGLRFATLTRAALVLPPRID